METVIISCKTLENELNRAILECGRHFDVKWVESGLHNVPNKLRAALQDVLDSLAGYSRVLMAIGFCGNSLSGLRTGEMTMIVPRVDDCISLLLGSCAKRTSLTNGHGMYFLTEGWLRGERTIWHEYQYTLEKYGKETCDEIFEALLGNYRSLVMLDTGCYDLLSIRGEAEEIAETLKLDYMVIPATIEYLKRLLTGPWDNDSFLTIPPRSVIAESDLIMTTTG